ncbi:hypothetical protein TSUD_194290 [Trifolium subterraneum]|uniref:Reverse transcriptase zinc-binding domain-containing protein n=1 Tax=Trifolium subterraneum TaxID=3900 RepID=A0A2Z6P4F0_TRISU|nr:hypothetical protein TSUD_194290 [Trifolium subterraneum]
MSTFCSLQRSGVEQGTFVTRFFSFYKKQNDIKLNQEVMIKNLQHKRNVLQQSGARSLAIPCHLSHWHSEISADSSLPFLHIGDCVAMELKKAKMKPIHAASIVWIGLLTTDSFFVVFYYKEKLQSQGFEVVLLDKEAEEHLLVPAVEALQRKDIEGARNLLRIAIHVLLGQYVGGLSSSFDDQQNSSNNQGQGRGNFNKDEAVEGHQMALNSSHFVLVVEGLSATIRRAEEIGMFKGFKVGNSGLPVSHLQYAYDTIFLGEASVENLWTLKTVLRCFEMASGLKVNFAKSSIMGVNVSSVFLYLAERFLHCFVGSIPFTYLGLPVGANPRKESTWKPLLMALSSKLGVWRNRFVSLGGRVVLLKSVLNSIPIFYLSFLKMPVKVWKQIVRLQRNFLWGGAGQERKIAWVSWDKICRPKNRGGLGIRDLRVVNLALLGKWRWRVIVGGGTTVASSDWFSEGVARKVGNGSSNAFWFDPWLGGLPLKDRYHRLFQVSEQCLELVENMGSREHGMEDSWVWTLDPTGSYSVKSAYLAITSVEVAPEPNSLLTRVWKSWAPSKVIVLSWQLLQDRVPTRQNLLRRRVLREASLSFCALCGDIVESVDHFFITCDCISIFWYNLTRWLGFELVSPSSIASLFEWFLGLGVGTKSRLGWLLIWHVAV